MTDNPLVERICGLVGDCLSIEAPTADADLIDDGLLDSLALVSLIAELEAEFCFEFPIEDFDVEHFRTPRMLADFLSQLGLLTAVER